MSSSDLSIDFGGGAFDSGLNGYVYFIAMLRILEFLLQFYKITYKPMEEIFGNSVFISRST